jgi:hypothetical protein
MRVRAHNAGGFNGSSFPDGSVPAPLIAVAAQCFSSIPDLSDLSDIGSRTRAVVFRFVVTFPHYRGCCIFGFLGFLVLLLAELVYGTPVQAG